jgi:hypothetical protein
MSKLSEIINKWKGIPIPPKKIKQQCLVCGKGFKGTVKINICPTCYV